MLVESLGDWPNLIAFWDNCWCLFDCALLPKRAFSPEMGMTHLAFSSSIRVR
jgi:hypothetical protein